MDEVIIKVEFKVQAKHREKVIVFNNNVAVYGDAPDKVFEGALVKNGDVYIGLLPRLIPLNDEWEVCGNDSGVDMLCKLYGSNKDQAIQQFNKDVRNEHTK